MGKPSDHGEGADATRDKIIGLGERSMHKSYFPQLQRRIAELEEAKARLEEQTGSLSRLVATLEEQRRLTLESEARYRTIFEATSEAILIHDSRTGAVIDANRRAREMFGVDEAQVSLPWFAGSEAASPPYSAEDARRRLRFALRGGQSFEWLNTSGTEERWLEVSLSSIRLGDGRRALAVVRDVTEKHRASVLLQQAHDRLISILELLPDPTFVVDVKGRIRAWNRAAERMTGTPKEALLWKGDRAYSIPFYGTRREMLVDLVDVPQGELESTYVSFRRAGGQVIGEAFAPPLRNHQGAYLWGTAAPLFNAQGERFGTIEVVRDVTEATRAKMALQESRTRFRALFENSPDAIFLVDPFSKDVPGKIVDCNPAACTMNGYTREELVGQSIDFIGLEPVAAQWTEEYNRRYISFLREAGQHRYEGCHRRKDGSIIHLEVVTTVVELDGRELFLGIDRDVTARKLAEEQLRQALKMEAVGRLAGGVAHDFNNLLTAILGYSELLEGQFGEEDKKARQVFEIRRAAERAAKLTGQLLAFGRKQVLEPRAVDLNLVVTDMARLLRSLVGESIDLTTKLDPHLRMAQVDPSQVEQVIMNLVVNARDAMPLGGRLEIRTQNGRGEAERQDSPQGRPPGDHVLVSVSDTGHGMDEEVLAHIFEPFYTTKELGKGTGLGLATVYGIVTQSGGTIEVRSQPEQGTTFTVLLPAAGGADAEAPTRLSRAPVPRGTGRVALVEDEDAVRDLALEVLRSHGYDVVAFRDPAEALQRLADLSEPLDVLVTDVVMPGMDGQALAERLAEHRPGLKVLFASGYAPGVLARHGVVDGASAFIQKPFTSEALVRKVRQVLEGSAGP
ncbi:MAG TPA: PAS domain S-box protein [Armatimonadota bacterium]|jgi:PAS domain S-box-containing protein